MPPLSSIPNSPLFRLVSSEPGGSAHSGALRQGGGLSSGWELVKGWIMESRARIRGKDLLDSDIVIELFAQCRPKALPVPPAAPRPDHRWAQVKPPPTISNPLP